MLTQGLIKQFARETKSANSGFTFLSIPHSSLLFPVAVEETKKVSAQRLQTFRATDEKLSEFTQENKIDGVNLLKELRNFSKNKDSYLYGFENNRLGYGHFSGYGHEKTADVLAQHICLKLSKS